MAEANSNRDFRIETYNTADRWRFDYYLYNLILAGAVESGAEATKYGNDDWVIDALDGVVRHDVWKQIDPRLIFAHDIT